MAPLIKEFQKHPEQFETQVCVTAQHRQMLDQVLNVFDIKPDFDLDIMSPNQDLYDITVKVLQGMKSVFKKFLPDILFVHGDTTTSMAAALAAFYLRIKTAHVEAGLRTYNLDAPWPEEMNRQMTDRLCHYYFVPTEVSKQNLLSEHVDENKIHITGNTVVDALFMAVEMIDSEKRLKHRIEKTITDNGYEISERYFEQKRKYILITGHRRENFGEGFLNICNAIKEIAIKNKEIDLVYPVHLNPNVQKPVKELLSEINNIFLIPPLDYLPFVYLMKNCHIILTDSGGIQEEAPSLKKPVLVMRDLTERPEGLSLGTIKLVGTKKDEIVYNVTALLENSEIYNSMAQGKNPYGDGKACKRIVAAI